MMNITKQTHHEKHKLCTSRPCYRQGRKLTSVKVYTVSDESTHLLVSKVPAIKLHSELCTLCNRFGDVIICTLVADYINKETFEETFHVQYRRIQSARYAKKQLDGRSFYGGVLHVCFAPELETLDETRAKLIQRRKEVVGRVKKKLHSFDAKHIVNGMSHSPGSNIKINTPVQTMLPVDNQNVCGSTLIGNQTKTGLPPYIHVGNHQVPDQSVCGTTALSFPQLVCTMDEGFNNSHFSPKVTNTPPASQSTLRFIPRAVAVSKRIVYHK